MTTKAELVAWLKTSTAVRVVLVEVENVLVSGVATTYYLSNRPYSDNVAGRLYTACIAGGVTFSESIAISGGMPSIGVGDIEIHNPVTESTFIGLRDDWLNYVWADKKITVLLGDVTWARTDFYPVFVGLVRDIDSKNRTSLNLMLVDNLQRLNVAVSDTVLGGTTAAKDKLIPLTFGECFNVTPLVADPSTLTYRVHPGQIERIIEVRDNGAPVTFTGNAATNNLNTGSFTLTRAPYGTITCSVQGSAPSGVYRQYIGETIRHILTSYGRQLADATYIDNTNFTNFDNTNSTKAVCGVYLEGRENVLEVCNRLANSVGAFLVPSLDGKFRLTQVTAGITGITPDYTVGAVDMESNSLTIREKVPVQASVKLAYCKNWTVQSSGLAAGLVQSNTSVLGYEYYYVYKNDDTTLIAQYGQSKEPPAKETLLVTDASGSATITDAQKEANRLYTVYSTPRFIYTATYYGHMLVAELGQTIKITHPRFGLGDGKIGTIVEINRDWLKGRVTLGVLI